MNIFGDSVGTMELEVIKDKIAELYGKMLETYYKKANPGHSDMELEDFLEANALEFESSEEELDEMDELMSMLDDMMDTGEDLEPVDGSGKAPDYTGTQLGAKSKEGSTAPSGTYSGVSTGGMMTPSDNQVKAPSGKKEEDPTGSINRKQLDEVVVQYSELVEKLKEELASLKQRQRIGVKEFRLG